MDEDPLTSSPVPSEVDQRNFRMLELWELMFLKENSAHSTEGEQDFCILTRSGWELIQ